MQCCLLWGSRQNFPTQLTTKLELDFAYVAHQKEFGYSFAYSTEDTLLRGRVGLDELAY